MTIDKSKQYSVSRAILLMWFSPFAIDTAYSEDSNSSDCANYIEFANNVTLASGSFPDALTSDKKNAIPCLAKVLDGLGGQIVVGKPISDDLRPKLLVTTGALRNLINVAGNYDDANSTTDGGAIDNFTRTFRQSDSINVASALSYGMRDENKSLRLNSLILMGNTVDNNTVCVPLAHLNDPLLVQSSVLVNARANFLGTISVVAPWANLENGKSIDATVVAVSQSLEANKVDPSLQKTFGLIENIKQRRAKASSLIGSMALDIKKACTEYSEKLKANSANLYYTH